MVNWNLAEAFGFVRTDKLGFWNNLDDVLLPQGPAVSDRMTAFNFPAFRRKVKKLLLAHSGPGQ
jgi:hypothetical protein